MPDLEPRRPVQPSDATPSRSEGASAPARRHALAQLAGLFLKLGTTAFGGPAVHIAMEDEVVRRRRWLTREQFLDLLVASG